MKGFCLKDTRRHYRNFNFFQFFKSNDDADGNFGLAKKALGLIRKTTTSRVHHAFLYISVPSSHDQDVELPNFTLGFGRIYDTGATFASERVHSGSLSWLYICFHPGSCTGARISLRYEISQRYHVNTKRPPVSV